MTSLKSAGRETADSTIMASGTESAFPAQTRIRPALFFRIHREKEGLSMVQNIINEMLKGNFSFLILLVGVLQLIAMLKKKR